MKPGKITSAMALASSFCVVPSLQAADLFQFQGPDVRVSGGAGLVESYTAASILHNPANLTKLSSHDFFDLGLTQLSYKFESRGRKSASGNLKTTVPLMSFGGGIRFLESWHVGIALMPLGLKGNEIKTSDFPVKIGQSLIVSDIKTEQASYKAALALSRNFSGLFRLGISAVYQKNDNRTVVQGSNPDNPLFIIKEVSEHVVPIIGLSGEWEQLSWGVAYTHAVPIPYRIAFKEYGNDEKKATGETYQAGSIGFGLSYRQSAYFNPYGQYIFERWAPGQDSATSAVLKVTEGDKGTDYRNTHNFVIGNKFRLSEQKQIYLSFAQYGANKASGVKDQNGDILYEGVKLRDFEAMDRIQATVGMSYQLWSRRVSSYFSYMDASADAPTGSPSEGLYQLRVFMLGSGIVL